MTCICPCDIWKQKQCLYTWLVRSLSFKWVFSPPFEKITLLMSGWSQALQGLLPLWSVQSNTCLSIVLFFSTSLQQSSRVYVCMIHEEYDLVFRQVHWDTGKKWDLCALDILRLIGYQSFLCLVSLPVRVIRWAPETCLSAQGWEEPGESRLICPTAGTPGASGLSWT